MWMEQKLHIKPQNKRINNVHLTDYFCLWKIVTESASECLWEMFEEKEGKHELGALENCYSVVQ